MRSRNHAILDWLGPLASFGRATLGLASLGFAFLGLSFLGCAPSPHFVPSMNDLVEGHYATAARMKTRDTSTPDSLIVVSYNIQYGNKIGRAAKDLSSNRRLRHADLIFLQEMDPSGTRTLARELGYDFVYFPASRHPKYRRLFGNAILSRWRIYEPRLVLLNHEGLLAGTQRVAVLATVGLGRKSLRVANVHTTTIITPREQRLRQFDEILQEFSPGDSVALVAGDFNTVTSNDVAKLRDMFRRSGFHMARLPEGPSIRAHRAALINAEPVLDHIFYRGLHFASAGIQSAAKASDHYPIWAVFSLLRE
jgi:endonuclease/exonuclease/phosphatase family metal-dependent hydrolase